jgi:hypothetical protein
MKISVRNPEGKKSAGKPGRRCHDDIKLDLKKIWWKVLNLIYLALKGTRNEF